MKQRFINLFNTIKIILLRLLQILWMVTEVAPLKFEDKLPCEFCSFQSVCHVDSLIDSKHYRHVDESINPIQAIQEVELESGEDNE